MGVRMADVYPTYGKSKTLAQIAATQSFIRLHTTMQARVTEIIVASGGKVGLGQGYRSFEDQKKLFLANYVPDPSGERTWEGKRWRHARGIPRQHLATPCTSWGWRPTWWAT